MWTSRRPCASCSTTAACPTGRSAGRTYYSKSHLHGLATGGKRPTVAAAQRIDDALDAGGRLVALARTERMPMTDNDLTGDMNRRTVLSALVALTAGGLLHQSLADDHPSTVDDWEEVAWSTASPT